MANLWTGEINASDYTTVASISGQTFSSGTKYQLQLDGIGYIREGQDGKGFIIKEPLFIDYTAGDEDLYIKATGAVLNIASAE